MEKIKADVTIKEQIAMVLLEAKRFMSVAELSLVTGFDARIISTAMGNARRESRFDIKKCMMPKMPGRSGPILVQHYRCDAIGPRPPKKVVMPKHDEQEDVLMRESDGDVSHLIETHNPLWHFAICRPVGARI